MVPKVVQVVIKVVQVVKNGAEYACFWSTVGAFFVPVAFSVAGLRSVQRRPPVRQPLATTSGSAAVIAPSCCVLGSEATLGWSAAGSPVSEATKLARLTMLHRPDIHLVKVLPLRSGLGPRHAWFRESGFSAPRSHGNRASSSWISGHHIHYLRWRDTSKFRMHFSVRRP